MRSGMTCAAAADMARRHNEWLHNSYSFSGFSTMAPAPNYVRTPSVEPPDGYGYALERVAHSSPDANCTCGIYAGRTAADCPSGDVLGKVKLWGTLIPGEKGSRAEFAYPSELHVPTKLADNPALLAYGVPIVVIDEDALKSKTSSVPVYVPGSMMMFDHTSPARRGRLFWFSIGANFGACLLNLGLIAARSF